MNRRTFQKEEKDLHHLLRYQSHNAACVFSIPSFDEQNTRKAAISIYNFKYLQICQCDCRFRCKDYVSEMIRNFLK